MTKKNVCRFCGSPHPDNTKFCPNTGKNLLESPQKINFAVYTEKIAYFLKHSLWKLPIWQFVGIVIGIVAVWATYDVFNKSQEIRDLQIVTLADTSLVEIKNDVATNIEVFYKGKEFSNLSLLQLKIENIGTEPILITDYVEQISIAFPKQAKIIESAIIASEPRNINAKATLENNTVSIEPVLLNSGDRFVIKLIVADIPPLCQPRNTWDNIPATARPQDNILPTPSSGRVIECVDERFEIQARITGISKIDTVNTIYERKSITQDITVRFVVLYSLAILFLVGIRLTIVESISDDSIWAGVIVSFWSAIKIIVVGLLISIVAYGILWFLGYF